MASGPALVVTAMSMLPFGTCPRHCLCRFCAAVGLLLLCLMSGVAGAAASVDDIDRAADAGLLQSWLKLEQDGALHAPYVYIRQRDTAARQNSRKQLILDELDRLIWRQQYAGRVDQVDSLQQWRRHIQEANAYRSPGAWDPATLLFRPRKAPPLTALAAIGACAVPDWVEIWNATGVTRIAWRGSLQLADLYKEQGPLRHAQADHVFLIQPTGRVVQRGIAVWNRDNAAIPPGTRIVVRLPLQGRALDWLADNVTAFLAHLRPGDDCRHVQLQPDRSYDAPH